MEGMICVSRPLNRTHGFEETNVVISESERPKSWKYLIFGLRVLSTSERRNWGRTEMRFVIWVLENPWVLKNSITEFGFSVALRLISLEAERADSGDNPHEFMR